ncbi:MAG: hypothetical protein LBC89_05830 [Bacteroidales bacterium]|jgi:hypothetical protein|nr:hypothetical protein [Bacteroidales bacterium]
MEVSSAKKETTQSASDIFSRISDFNNFGKLLPPQISNWKSTTENCSFDIQNMATLAMKFKEKTSFSKVVIESEAPSPFKFELQIEIQTISENLSETVVKLNADIPMMLSVMVKKPLQQFVDMLNEAITK